MGRANTLKKSENVTLKHGRSCNTMQNFRKIERTVAEKCERPDERTCLKKYVHLDKRPKTFFLLQEGFNRQSTKPQLGNLILEHPGVFLGPPPIGTRHYAENGF